MATIYVVTAGAYSDYGIVGVFDNKELAEKLAKHGNGEVEEWDLNPEYADYRKQGFSSFLVIMSKGGIVVKFEEDLKVDLYLQPEYFLTMKKAYTQENTAFPALSRNEILLRGNLIEKTPEQAIKIVNEKRIRLLAEGRWRAFQSI